MSKRLASAARLAVGPILVLMGMVAMPTVSRGQLYTTDPYDPSGRAYRSYVYPRGGDEFAAGFAPRGRGYVAPNQLDRYTDSLDSGLGGRGARYDSSFRRFDTDFGRVYTQSDQDKKYVESRERRERDMIRAMTERDPKKRAQLVREAEDESKKGTGDTSLSVRRGASGPTVATAPTRRAPRPSGAANGRPAAGSVAPTRRPETPSTTGRSPSSTRSGTNVAPTRPRPASPASGGSAAPTSSRSRPTERMIDRVNPRPSDVIRRSQERNAENRPAVDSPAPVRPR